MAVKSTFTLDDETTRTIRQLAEREGKPQSLIVREAVAHYAARDDKSTLEERTRALTAFDDLVARVAPRPRKAIEEEAATVRKSRRAGWRHETER